MHIKHTTMFRLAAVFLTASLTLFGYVGSASASAPIKMNVGYTASGLNFGELFVAEALGIFKKHGLDVTLKRVNSSSQAIPAVRSGSVDIVASGGNAAITGYANGIHNLTVIGDLVPHGILEVWVQPYIKTPRDLIGKVISSTSPQSLGDILTGVWLNRHGIKRSQVHIVYLGGLANLVAGMRSKRTAATLILPPLGNQLAATGQKKLGDLRDIPYSSHAYVSTKTYVKAHPQAVLRFLKATIEATAIFKQDKARVMPVFPKYSGVTNQALNAYAYEFFKPIMERDPRVRMSVMKETQRLSPNKRDHSVDLNKIIDNSFVEKLEADGYIKSLYKK